jgi:hypothetical protein
MTALKAEAPTRRETAITIQGRPLLIEAGPRLLTLRLKGRRYRYEIAWESVWLRAAELEGRRRIEERRKKRAERRRLARP